MSNKILLLFLPLLLVFSGYTQNNPSTWFELGFSKEMVKTFPKEQATDLIYRADWPI